MMSTVAFLSHEDLVQHTWSFVPWRKTVLGRAIDSRHSSWLLGCPRKIDGLGGHELMAAKSTLLQLINLDDVVVSGDPETANTTELQLPPLPNLKALTLRWAWLQSVTPLQQLQNLRCLDLSWCTFPSSVAELCAVLQQMPTLQALHLTGCSQQAQFNTQSSMVGEQLLMGVAGVLPAMHRLHQLDVAYCTAGDQACAALVKAAAHAPMLRRLHLEGNCAQPKTLKAIAALGLEACDALEGVAPTGTQLDGCWAVVAGTQAGIDSDFWTGSWVVVSAEGTCWDCIMNDVRSERATVSFHGTTSLHELCNSYDANAEALVMDMRFASHPVNLNGIFKLDHRGVLVAARDDHGGAAPTNFCGGRADDCQIHQMTTAFVRVHLQDGKVRHPISGEAWDLTNPQQPRSNGPGR